MEEQQRLGSYELIRKLGEGGMAQVWLARDTRLGREVAVKVLASRLAEQPGFRQRFLREARVAAALDHPNIVPLYDYGETGALYLVMPFMSGGSVQSLIKRGPLPSSTVATYGSQIADALDFAHRRNVVHRDVKPANMLLHADGRVMLADFGLAKILDGTSRPVTSRGRPDAGTPEYMAPEQIEGRTEARSDIYGLGVVLYLLLTGYLPFTGPTSGAVMEGHLYHLPEPPRRRNPRVPPALEAVVLRALAKHPDDRYQTAGELGAALLAALVAGDAEPLSFISEPSAPPVSPPFGISHVPGQVGNTIPPSFVPSRTTGVATGMRSTSQALPYLNSATPSQRPIHQSATSAMGRMSFAGGLDGGSGMYASSPSALQPARSAPPGLASVESLPSGLPFGFSVPSQPSTAQPVAHDEYDGWQSVRLRVTLAVLFALLVILIGAILVWAGVISLPGA